MSFSCKLSEKGELLIDISEALNYLSLAAKREIVQTLACDDELFKDVCDVLIDGQTEDGYWGGGVDQQRERLVAAVDPIASALVEEANRKVKYAQDRAHNCMRDMVKAQNEVWEQKRKCNDWAEQQGLEWGHPRDDPRPEMPAQETEPGEEG